MTYRTIVAFALSALSFLATTNAAAADEPCGKFDFSDGVFDCKIEVEGGCTAQCTPLSFKAGCTGGCSGTATQDCTGTCGEACLIECNPELLDCFKGCHAECDAEVEALCKAEDGAVDCAEQAVAQCDMHCESSCEVPPSNCQDHCVSCCNGGCTTQVNFQCDFDCFAELKGGCDVQCSKPDGALFCNGQYVYASDITACITHLATQGINVDVSASATLECGADGCDLGADLSAGVCSTVPGRIPDAEILMTLMLAGLAMSVRRSAKASRHP